jgi:hypothetical protein
MSPRGGTFAEFGIAFDCFHMVFESGLVTSTPVPKWVRNYQSQSLERAEIFEASFLGNGEAPVAGNLAK